MTPEQVIAALNGEVALRKATRLDIAARIYAGMIVNAGRYPLGDDTRRLALEQADALVHENEAMS